MAQTNRSGLSVVRTVPVLLLLLCVVSYSLLAPLLGFYWDDWLLAWISSSLGSAGFRQYTAFTRPAQGWLYSLTTPLLGEVPLHWHLFALCTRWLGAVAAWSCLRGLWPQRSREVAAIALLFTVYPGFSQQPIAMSYGSDFIHLALFMLSLSGMIWALRRRHLFWWLSAMAIVCSVLSSMLTEYYAGLELVRPVMIWLVLKEMGTDGRKLLRRTMANWSPYLVVVAALGTWRLLFFKNAAGYLNQSAYIHSFVQKPFAELMTRASLAVTDVIEAGLIAWGQAAQPGSLELQSRSVWVALGLSMIAGIAVALYLTKTKSVGDLVPDRFRWAKDAILLGLVSMVVGGLPVWFINRDVRLGDFYDRYTLPMMLGACVFLVGLTQLVIRTRFQQMVAIATVVGLSVGFHFRNGNRFRQDWEGQKAMFWQLTWRAPGLKRGTSIITDKAGIIPSDDFALAAPLNLIYSPNHSSPQMAYWFFNLSAKSGRGIMLEDGVRLEKVIGNLSFSGSTSSSLAVWVPPNGCLRVLSPADELPQLPPLARTAQRISQMDQIILNPNSPARPPIEIFGPEPDSCWCYYFEKADLAGQMGDWQEVVRLADEAQRNGFKAAEATEWLPFIEGYIRSGRRDAAKSAVTMALGAKANTAAYKMEETYKQEGLGLRDLPAVEPALLRLFQRLEDGAGADTARRSIISELRAQLTPANLRK